MTTYYKSTYPTQGATIGQTEVTKIFGEPEIIEGAPYPRYKDLFCNVIAGMLTNLDEDSTDFSKFNNIDLITTYENGSMRSRTDYRIKPARKYAGKIIDGVMTVDQALLAYYSATGWITKPTDKEGNPILF